MAEGGEDGDSRSIEQTPTWAVAIVCLCFILISILIEQAIHFLSKWLKKRRKKALSRALDKIKEELMLLGFMSLMLTVGQRKIAEVCISESLGDTLLPCTKEAASDDMSSGETQKFSLHRKLMFITSQIPLRRGLATEETTTGYCAAKGKVPLISQDGLNQLHIFIFVLAVCHVLSFIIIMALGWAKIKKWKVWEEETKTLDYEFSTDPSKFRFTRDTTFGRRHTTFWFTTPFLNWIVCFFRQFFISVPKVDYLTLRHGFIMAHFAPRSRFDFQNYIKKSLGDDFSAVVSISPPLWFFAILFLLLNRKGWFTFFWLSFIPLIILLIVGTKLQVIITRMAIDIQDRNPVVQGPPVVKPNDQLFWFGRPKFILYLIHFTLFQSSFQLAFFFWAWYEYGLESCFHDRVQDIVVRVSCGLAVQILCSYVTLPLYALVTQLGTNMKTTIFDERVASALKKWHGRAKKKIREKRNEDLSSRGSSPLNLFRKYMSSGDLESAQNLERVEYDIDTDAPSPSPSPHSPNKSPSPHSPNKSPSPHSPNNANNENNEKLKEKIEEERRDDSLGRFELSFDHFRNGSMKNIISTSYRESDSRIDER